jgi:replication-associated recombination protein RarA
MKQYFGHKKNVKAVRAHLPPVLLFQGPASVGKWELAEYIREHWKFKNSDVLKVKRLTKDNARFIVKFTSERPKGFSKLVIVRLDRKATKGALNTLLKALEEAPDATFILITEEDTIPTIRSRAILYPFGLLSDEDVYNILTVRRNFPEDRASMLSKVAGGQVRKALSYNVDQENKATVLKAVDAVSRKDSRALDALAPKWQQEHTELLVQWCYESMTTRWKLFIEDETSVKGNKIPLRILIALKEDLRPRLVVRSALASVLQER